jgi:diaminohydroxyphosphoribosylaminopyrimidine deaminase / 5-amino-6-(5-phosphoribosylamino)uracil reductase
MPSKAELKFMRRALFLARSRGRYASPNPKMGAVLAKGGRIVGEGGHSRYGGPHAEIIALRQAGEKARGAALYVTLEPCSHHGKTPPCVEAVIRAGVRKVVAAMKDPFPLVRGRGFQKLRQAGIAVEMGLLEEEARQLNEAFLFAVTHGRPRVLLKAAMSLDGKIASVSGQSRWITGIPARQRAHVLRAQSDAILVGSRTALKDNPSLTVRLPGYPRKDGWPLRVVLDTQLRVSPRSNLFQGKAKTVLFTAPSASREKERALARRGAAVFRVPLRGKMLSLKAVLRVLHSLQVRSLLVEGGGEVHASFLKEKLADEVALFISPKILGGPGPSWAGGEGIENPNRAPYLRDIRVEKIGSDFLMTGRV